MRLGSHDELLDAVDDGSIGSGAEPRGWCELV